ncbi:MAG: MerR family transcriptional regulator, partial [Myxococcota bacterium]|nr:MerR family transcriptional regulator [Myxococcota bacterium]
MAAKHQGLSIGEVARRSHMSTHTIRAWERRYNVITPLRSAGGTRRYSRDDVERLKLLKAAVE